QLMDEVYIQYKYLSLWESSIENPDPISSLTDKYTNYHEFLRYLKNLTPNKTDYIYHPDYKGPIDRYSWIEELNGDSDHAAKADLADGYGVFLTFDPNRGD